jgi:hypothetical protein
MTGASSRPETRTATSRRTDADGLDRLAGPTLVVSGLLAAVGVAFLVAMFVAFGVGDRAAGMKRGLINDVLVLVSFPLVVPAMLVIRRRLRPEAPLAIDVATAVGLTADAAIIVLQALLIRGDLSFEEQIGWVSVAFVAFDVWLIVVGWFGSRSGLLPGGVRMGLGGATYVGAAVWALWAARRLATEHDPTPSETAAR